MVFYKSLGRHRQTDRDVSLGSLSVLSCYFGLVGCCRCFLLASFLFLKDLFAAFFEGFFFPFPCSFFFVWVGGWCFSLGEGGCFVWSRKWVLESSSDPVSDKDFGEYLLPYLVCFCCCCCCCCSLSLSLSLSLSHTHTHTHIYSLFPMIFAWWVLFWVFWNPSILVYGTYFSFPGVKKFFLLLSSRNG